MRSNLWSMRENTSATLVELEIMQTALCTLASTSRHNGWWPVVDTALEHSWAPIHKLDGSLGLDCCNCSVDILGDNITTVHEAASHVLSMMRITFGHHGRWLKSTVGDLGNQELLMISLLG